MTERHRIMRTRVVGVGWIQFRCTCGWSCESDDLEFATKQANEHLEKWDTATKLSEAG